ncbi:MAG: FAD-dependent oxidoreductase [Pseudomonadota bacterium]|nr:FAD-dependent oxidoreductase [Pseudomonadota bacterium]
METIVIIGGGFAGLWAALGAARQVDGNEANIQITVISKDPYLNIRPRLYEKDPKTLRVQLSPTLDPVAVQLVEGTVASVDAVKDTIEVMHAEGLKATMHYDRLILATGSELKNLPITGLAEHGWNIDTYDAAIALDQHLGTIMQTPDAPGYNTFVIIGAGFTGIELVTEMRDRIEAHSNAATAENSRIILVERAAMVAPDLGSNPRPAVEAALRDANIEVRLGMSVDAVTSDTVTLNNGEKINTKTVITTAGLRATALDETLPVERDEPGRIATDGNLRVKGISAVFAAGDVARAYADDEHLALMSCQHAMEMGKYAGYNAARDLLGLPLHPYQQPVYLTCLDLGRSGALFTSGWDRQIQKSGDDAKDLKRQINTQWIYPPTGTREQILAAAQIDVRSEEIQYTPKAVNERNT